VPTFEFWRDISVGSPDDTVNRYTYDTADDSVTPDSFNVATGTLGPINPPVGTVMFQVCDGLDLVQYKSIGNNTGLNKVTLVDNPTCCTIEASDFSVVKTNNTSLLTPNGTIVITAPVEDIGDYEASIDGGDTWVTQIASAITFEDLPAGNYSIIIRAIAGVCSVTTAITIADQITYPPLIISESTQPSLYAPVFHPITIGFTLDNNDATIKEDMNGTYLEVSTQDAKDYLGTLPIIKIIQNEDYAGTYQITEVDDPDDPQKFYFDKAFTTEQAALFVPFDRQVFQLFAERSFNNYQKIADITVYPNAEGEYLIRLEGFLQSVFAVMPPINDGDEITLLRKYYVLPRDFDMEDTASIYNAVYSAISSLTPYLDELIPLGPAPINFINEQTQKGLPVLFSYIDLTTGRVKNITSSDQTEIINTTGLIFINALPLDVFDVTWINPAGAIADLQVDPALPDWITIQPSPSDTVQLHIDTGLATEGGDYDGSDYDGDDYLTGGPNSIVGCYTFEFSDGVTPLFTLQICVFPIQSSNEIKCAGGVFNIAWVNRQGGWSSYAFEGRKLFGKEIEEVKTYKSGLELKRSSVEGVYDTVEINIANKPIRDLQFIASLRQSIQAFLWSELTQQWSIPIVLDKQSFAIYSTPFKQIQVDDKFRFRYAEEVLIQSQ
jgi:hypothetical protein